MERSIPLRMNRALSYRNVDASRKRSEDAHEASMEALENRQ
jgi:hypothetical protein